MWSEMHSAQIQLLEGFAEFVKAWAKTKTARSSRRR